MNEFRAAEELNPLIPHLSEIILGIVVFLILVYLVGKFVVPNFEKAFSERTAAIEGGMKEAERAQAEAKEALEKYTAQLAEARHEAATIREHAREQGATIIAEMREQAQVESQRLVSTAHAQINADRQQAVQQLRSEVGALATTLAGRIVGESLEDEARQRRTVERFIAEIEESGAPLGGVGAPSGNANGSAGDSTGGTDGSTDSTGGSDDGTEPPPSGGSSTRGRGGATARDVR